MVVVAAAVVAVAMAATMTDRPGSIAVVTVAAAVFLVVLTFLALQVRAGADPAIGAGPKPVAPTPRQVIVRRVIIKRIVEEDAPPAAPGIVASASAPAPSAPAAPAPAPAPVVTRAS